MARHKGPVLVDTNVIIECHRAGAWAALAGGYAVETVEKCVEETQTGFQRRQPAYTTAWLDRTLAELVIEERKK